MLMSLKKESYFGKDAMWHTDHIQEISDFHHQGKCRMIIGILTIFDAYQRSIEAAKYQRAIAGRNNKMQRKRGKLADRTRLLTPET